MNRNIAVIILLAGLMAPGALALGLEENQLSRPGLTPDSPLYFADRLGDWVRLNIFTFNPVRKAEVKVRIAEERLSELNDLSGKKVKQEILEKLEEAVAKKAEEAGRDAENLDAQNQNVSRLAERLSDFNLKRQRVLENVLERVPEEARDKVETALNNVYKGIDKSREMILKQKEKGFISEEKVKEILENRLAKMKEQLEKRKERLEGIEDEALKERLENVVEQKIEALESEILDVESKEGLKEIREKIQEVRREAIESSLQLRSLIKRRATTTEEALENIRQRKDNRENQ